MKKLRTTKQRWKIDVEADRMIHIGLMQYAEDHGLGSNKRLAAEKLLGQILKRKGYPKPE
jgi:hypothetical protein